MPSSILMRGAQTLTFLYTISILQPPDHTNKLGSFLLLLLLLLRTHIHYLCALLFTLDSSMFYEEEEEEGNSGII
jgi:hypothetical protein